MERTDNSELTTLLADYSNLRDDERQGLTVIVSMAGVAMAFLTAVAAFVPPVCLRGQATGCTEPWVFAFVPLAPLAVIAYVTVLGATATIRSYYLRALERKLEEQGVEVPAHATDVEHQKALPVPSFFRLNMLLVSPRRALLPFRYLQLGLMVLIAVLFLAVATSAVAAVRPISLQVTAAVTYFGGAAVLAWATVRASVNGRNLWNELIEKSDVVLAPFPARAAQQEGRNLLSLLVMPRPIDFAVKATIMPLTILAIVAAPGPPSRVNGWSVVVLVLFFEWVAYQTRYLWNDLRNLTEDAKHPSGHRRGRLGPPDTDERLAAGLGLLAIRLMIYLLTGIAIQDVLNLPAFVITVPIFLIGALYENVRDAASREDAPAHRFSVRKTLVYVTVGFGYALRVVVAMWIGVGLDDPYWYVVGALLGYFLGVMFVTMAWALEGVEFVSKVVPIQPASTRALTGDDVDAALSGKRHLGPLVMQVGAARSPVASTHDVLSASVLRSAATLPTLWSSCYIAAAAAAGWLGAGLATGLPAEGVGSQAVAALPAAAAATLIAYSRGSILIMGTLALVHTAAIAALIEFSEVVYVVPAAVPFIVVTLTYWTFLRMSRDDAFALERVFRDVWRNVRHLGEWLLVTLLGKASAERLQRRRRQREPVDARTP